MRCLSAKQCRAWLAPSGLTLDKYLRLQEPGSWAHQPSRHYLIEQPRLGLQEFCGRLLDWMPAGRERLLIVSNWSAFLPNESFIFQTIRQGCGVSETLADAPGHLFTSTKEDDTDDEDRPSIDVAEEAVARWLMRLMLEWTWEGYAVVKGCRNAVWLGDGLVRFLCTDSAANDAANAMMVGEA